MIFWKEVSGMIPRKLRTILSVILIFYSGSHSFAQDKGGRWTFEGNGSDIADWDREENPGVLQGTASYQSFAPLLEGTSFIFLDSADVHDFFRVEDNPDLDFDDENIGVSMWIYPMKIGDDVHYLLNKGDQYINPKTTNYALRISKQKQLEFLIRDANNQAQRVISTYTIPESQWTFVAVYYDFTAGKVYMWNAPHVDPVDTLDFHQSFFANDDPLAIGSWYTSDPATPSVKDFNGRIDDVRIGNQIQHIMSEGTTLVNQTAEDHPCHFRLMPNYPNPFNAHTMIAFDMNRSAHVSLRVYDIRGRLVTTLIEGRLSQDRHFITLHAHALATGIYYVQLCSDSFQETQKMLLMR